MTRPTTPRQIAPNLEGRTFKPQGVPRCDLTQVDLSLDGLEALRLADVEGLYQEEAASRMGISRATFARVLAQARRTVAEAIVEGRALVIRGGTIERRGSCGVPACAMHATTRRGRRCTCRRPRRRRTTE